MIGHPYISLGTDGSSVALSGMPRGHFVQAQKRKSGDGFNKGFCLFTEWAHLGRRTGRLGRAKTLTIRTGSRLEVNMIHSATHTAADMVRI